MKSSAAVASKLDPPPPPRRRRSASPAPKDAASLEYEDVNTRPLDSSPSFSSPHRRRSEWEDALASNASSPPPTTALEICSIVPSPADRGSPSSGRSNRRRRRLRRTRATPGAFPVRASASESASPEMWRHGSEDEDEPEDEAGVDAEGGEEEEEALRVVHATLVGEDESEGDVDGGCDEPSRAEDDFHDERSGEAEDSAGIRRSIAPLEAEEGSPPVVHAVPESRWVRRVKVRSLWGGKDHWECGVHIAWAWAFVFLLITLVVTTSVLLTVMGANSTPKLTPPLTTERVFEVVEPLTVTASLTDRGSPQRQALRWLVEEDGLAVPAGDEEWIVQRFALATFYFALGGPDSLLAGEGAVFLAPVHECEWTGIECMDNNEPIIQIINFPHANLTGTIPPELGLLKELRHLYLTSNTIHGSIPSSIGNLKKLEELSFLENQLTGALPPELGNLVDLSLLFLARNELFGRVPKSLANLKKLLFVFLDDNDLTGSLDFMCHNDYVYFISDCVTQLQCSCCTFCG